MNLLLALLVSVAWADVAPQRVEIHDDGNGGNSMKVISSTVGVRQESIFHVVTASGSTPGNALWTRSGSSDTVLIGNIVDVRFSSGGSASSPLYIRSDSTGTVDVRVLPALVAGTAQIGLVSGSTVVPQGTDTSTVSLRAAGVNLSVTGTSLNSNITNAVSTMVVQGSGGQPIGSYGDALKVYVGQSSQNVSGSTIVVQNPISSVTLQASNGASIGGVADALKAYVVNSSMNVSGSSIIVREVINSGRQIWIASTTAVAGTTSDTVITFSTSSALNGNGANATSLTVPVGKTLRIQSMAVAWRNTAVGNSGLMRLRAASSGACTAASPLLYTVTYSTLAAAGGLAPVPDGVEFTGANTLCATHIDANAATGLDFQIIGITY